MKLKNYYYENTLMNRLKGMCICHSERNFFSAGTNKDPYWMTFEDLHSKFKQKTFL